MTCGVPSFTGECIDSEDMAVLGGCPKLADPNPIWPSSLLRTVANFRSDDHLRNLALYGLFALRFLLGNLSNGQWQANGKKLSVSTLACAVFFSCWSIFLLGCVPCLPHFWVILGPLLSLKALCLTGLTCRTADTQPT